MRVFSCFTVLGEMDVAVSAPDDVVRSWGLDPENTTAVKQHAIAQAKHALRDYTPYPGDSWSVLFRIDEAPLIRRV